MYGWIAFAFLAALFLPAPSLPHAVEPSTAPAGADAAVKLDYSLKFEPYAVPGSSLAEIVSHLERRRISAMNGQGFDGSTRWRLTIPPQSEPCRPAELVIGLEVLIALPEVGPDELTHSEERVVWDRYHAALRQHELRHAELIRREGVSLAREMSRVRSCSEVFRLARVHDRRIYELNRQLDEQTAHGGTDGADPATLIVGNASRGGVHVRDGSNR